MTSPKILLSLLLLVSLVSAFDVSEYLYSYEEDVSVSYTNFTLKGVEYSIVEIGGEESFLLKQGEVVENQSEIESVIYSYYLKAYYPSEEEISDLRGLVDAYNDSRNDGQKFIGKEEYACRSVIFIDGRVKSGADPIYCRNESDAQLCNYSAMLMYQYLSSITTPPVASWEYLVEPIKDFGFASYGMDVILGNAVEKFEAAEEDERKMYDALDYLEDSISTMESYHSDIEGTVFTWTEKQTCDASHWCLCPDHDLNDSVLDQIEDDVGELIEKMEPFKEYESISEKIYSNSAERLEYAYTERLVQSYTTTFSTLNKTGADAIELGDEAVKHVLNNTLSGNLLSLKSLHQSIPEDLEDKNYSKLEGDISDYRNLTEEVMASAVFLLEHYNDTKEAKNLANSLILVLESKDLDPVSTKSLQLLKNESGDLDAEFRDGLTLVQLAELESNYTELAREAQELLKSENNMPANKVLLLFRGYARNVNAGIANFAETTEVVEVRDIPDNSLTLVLFSALVFVSLASIVLLVFLHIMATTTFTIPKTGFILASAFVCLMLLLLGFSMLMYLFLGKTSTDATLPEFLADLESKDSATILLDLRDTSYADSLAMNSCASSLADSFSGKNKSWTLYTLTANTCTQKDSSSRNATLSPSDCMERAENSTSLFMLGYSPSNEPPKFSVIYKNKAEIRANLDYYESCPLVALFS